MMHFLRLVRRTARLRHFLVAVGVLGGTGILVVTLRLLERDRQGELRPAD